MADFPTSVFNPANRSNGQTIDASHVNNLQAEVTAIEDGYLNGTARLNSSKSTVAALSVAGASTFAGDVNFGNNNVYFSQNNVGNSGSTNRVDWSLSNKQTITLTENSSVTFVAPNGPCNLVLMVRQDGTGSRTLAWSTLVKWPNGTAPTLSTAASAIDIMAFYYDSTHYYGQAALTFS